MNEQQAPACVEQHGVVLASARGKAPTLAEAIAGAPIKGGCDPDRARAALGL